MATNLTLVMRNHRKAKMALREFTHSKTTFDLHDVKVINGLEKHIDELEEMMMVFVPKNFLNNQLTQILK